MDVGARAPRTTFASHAAATSNRAVAFAEAVAFAVASFARGATTSPTGPTRPVYSHSFHEAPSRAATAQARAFQTRQCRDGSGYKGTRAGAGGGRAAYRPIRSPGHGRAASGGGRRRRIAALGTNGSYRATRYALSIRFFRRGG